MPRCLFGPVNQALIANLTPSPDLVFFDTTGELDRPVLPGDSWDDLLKRLPEGWTPELLILWLPDNSIPSVLWNAPIPIVGLAPRWARFWHSYRRTLKHCDRVFTDKPGVALLQREGIDQAREADFNGLETSFGSSFASILAVLQHEWPDLEERARRRASNRIPFDLTSTVWDAAAGGASGELSAFLEEAPDSVERRFALGLLAGNAGEAAEGFDKVLDLEPSHPLAGLNRAEALALAGKKEEAIRQARQSLVRLERTDGFVSRHLNAPHYPTQDFDVFGVEWERAAWQHAGDPARELPAKRNLVRWRLHSLLAELTGDLTHYQAAVMVRPDIPKSRAALGCGLARAKRFGEALPHLRTAVAANRFDRMAARALFQALGDAGDFVGRGLFAREQAALHQATPERVRLDDWMKDPPPTGRERASLIVLACNQAELTRLCLESVLRHTRGDYELILVDNGSTDGIPQLFEEIQALSGPARVEIIRNETNQGFAAGVNQGLATAQGEFIVLLNNDAVVTPGWLDGLIGWSLYEWPTVGLVGPTSNFAPPPQLVPASYRELSGLNDFVRQRRRQFAGRAMEVQRLTGFCLLIRRSVLARIGGQLDEQFGLGFFEDDDVCMRVRQAGFKLFLAQDVYVHHFGNKTFEALGINPEEQLGANFQRFRQKWGEQAAAPYRMPNEADQPVRVSLAPASTVPATVLYPNGQPKVSLCVIARNEEKNLPACLTPLRGVVDEIVVLDTGSTDNTKQVAAALGARVFEMPWPDSFAGARNASIEHARGEWIFWMDADDRVDAENVGKLKELFASLDGSNVAYVMKCLCVASSPGETATAVDHIRLFRNDPRHRWKYRVHEQILPSIRTTKGAVQWPGIVIQHTGYTEPALRRRKLERDLHLLRLEEKEHPDDPFNLFNLGSVFHELKQPKNALLALRRSLERSHEKDSIVRKLYALIAQCHREIQQSGEALQTIVKGRSIYPDDAELLFLESIVLRERGDSRTAEERLHRLINGREENHFGSVDIGLRGYKGRHNLAVICLEQKRFSEAETHWQAAVQEQPAFLPAQVGLGEVYAHTKRWDQLESHAQFLGRFGERGEEHGLFLLGLGKMHAGELAAARFRLTLGAGQFPKSLRIKRLLAQVTLQEGADMFAAEKVLRDILELDPKDEQAKRALENMNKKRAA